MLSEPGMVQARWSSQGLTSTSAWLNEVGRAGWLVIAVVEKHNEVGVVRQQRT